MPAVASSAGGMPRNVGAMVAGVLALWGANTPVPADLSSACLSSPAIYIPIGMGWFFGKDVPGHGWNTPEAIFSELSRRLMEPSSVSRRVCSITLSKSCRGSCASLMWPRTVRVASTLLRTYSTHVRSLVSDYLR